jgi:hypothetical protein
MSAPRTSTHPVRTGPSINFEARKAVEKIKDHFGTDMPRGVVVYVALLRMSNLYQGNLTFRVRVGKQIAGMACYSYSDWTMPNPRRIWRKRRGDHRGPSPMIAPQGDHDDGDIYTLCRFGNFAP